MPRQRGRANNGFTTYRPLELPAATMDTGSSIDALVASALVVLGLAIALSGAALLVLGRASETPADAPTTAFGATGFASSRVGADEGDNPALVVVPMHRSWSRERDVQQFLAAADDAQARIDQAMDPDRRRLIEAAQRWREGSRKA